MRGQSVLLDSDVAELYKVETKRVNEAVKNNPDKFPHDFIFEISEEEFGNLRSKFSTAKFAKTRVLPKAFSKKGLYSKAHSGIIKNYTCVGSSYEEPENLDIVIDTSVSTIEESVKILVDDLVDDKKIFI